MTEASGLAERLRRALRGEVRFDRGGRALYATDASNYRQVPLGVVYPRDREDVVRAVAACREFGAPVLPRGAGTSLAGQGCNVAVVLDFSRHLNRVLSIDPDRRLAQVEPGCVLDHLRDTATREHRLTFGPDPATHRHCTLGGMIGNNSCGVHSVRTGRTSDNVHALTVLTSDGQVMEVGATPPGELARRVAGGGREGALYAGLAALRDAHRAAILQRFPRIPRRVSGYNLDELLPERGFHLARALAGTEGTCVTVLDATVHLVPSPGGRALLLLGFPDVAAAADAVPALLEFRPIGLEGIDQRLVEAQKARGRLADATALLPEGGGWLLAEFGADDAGEAAAIARSCAGRIGNGRVVTDPVQQLKVWEIRETALGVTAVAPGQPHAWEGFEDSAVAPARLGPYLRELRALIDGHGYQGSFYGHFGEGCVHVRITFDLESREGVRRFRAFMEEAADLVLAHGGSLSGEHGDGQARAELLPKMFGDDLVGAFRRFKELWDPDGRMNPGKVVDPRPLDADLRLGAGYAPARRHTHFAFPADGGSFDRAVQRCVGVGRCRREAGATMCPSFKVTRDEQHSTRGRARLLFEMLQGEVLPDGWRSREVREALDLCLACKGCKSDCPTGVDLATWKAEFLSHHYAGRIRPRAAYSMGLVAWWLRAGEKVPGLVNLLTQSAPTAALLKKVGGIARERAIPRLARRTFRSRYAPSSRPGREVVLWPDTFHDHFHPEVLEAGAEVLEAAGFRPVLPRERLCCGRPLYDHGFLGIARRLLARILDALEDPIERRVPVVGFEPSCVAVFRDELPNLFPHDPRALALSRLVFTLGEFLEREAPAAVFPRLGRRALLHLHCHHKAVLDPGATRRLLDRLGLAVEAPDTGCCGMAGAFGFEERHLQVSRDVGELVLLPAVRAAAPDTLIVADGFSCREQIVQETGRAVLHPAEVAAMALRA